MEHYIGRLLDGRYEIREILGTGGMAVVYKALDHRLNRPVALKILKEELSRNEEFRRRFHGESQAVAMVSHPNIVGVYDVSSSPDADYIVMELIEGITLKQYLQRKGNLNWRETLHFSIQIAKALEHAHSKGIVHRDIKPHNIMILKDGSIKVADFGIARIGTSQNTLTREALGSVHYISPEQARGAMVDNRSDLYSLGVVMYEMLTGKTPYDGETPVSVAIQHINGGAHVPSELVTGIPLGLEQITMHAMNSNADMRYSSATEMLRNMEEFRKDPTMTFSFGAVAAKTPVQPAPLPKKPAPPRTDAERYVIARSNSPQARSPEERRSQRALKEAQMAEDKRKRNLIVAIAASAVILLILVVSVVVIALGSGGRQEDPSESTEEAEIVRVDDFVGMLLSDVDPELFPHLRLDVENVEEAYSDKYDAGYIIKQEPEADSEVKRGRTVRFTVSKGKDESLMPDFIDRLGTEAHEILHNLNLGLKIRLEDIGDEDITKGYVVRTEPKAGEKLSKNQNVTLYISLGSNKMPKLEGESLEKAEERLNSMELNLKLSTLEEASETVPKGYVIRTDPEEGEELDKGQRITLYVSLGSNKMPDLIGESKNNAEVLLNAMEMDLRISLDLLEDSETVPEGQVCRTEPEAGATLVKGQHVKVYISTGSKYTVVPDVLGKTEAQARALLKEAGLECELGEPDHYEGVEIGLVGGMSVKPESKIEKGETVIIYLCKEAEVVTEPTTQPTEPTEPSESVVTETPVNSEGENG